EARILKDTDDTIKANFERSKNRLAEEAVNLAMDLALKTIESQKREQVDELLQKAFITDLKSLASSKETIKFRAREGGDPESKKPYIKGLAAAAEEVQ
ncbi:MAG TPA: hypothetical protein VEL47_00865, partial [Myxococcota bacterium]|nr:hypothetical protein [Myxococcota bacterium]